MDISSATANERRDFLRQSGYLAVGFGLLGLSGCSGEARAAGTGRAGEFIGPPADNDRVNAWLRIHADNTVTVLTGKIAIGQGILVALRQIAAEELDLSLEDVKIIMADTGHTPDESYTAGSASIEGSGRAIRRAAATARQLLLKRAADRFGLGPGELTVSGGVIAGPDADQSLTYGQLVAGEQLTAKVSSEAPQKRPGEYRLVGHPRPRPEIVAMVTGGKGNVEDDYVQNMRLPGMVHARVVRPPVYRARLISVPEDEVRALPGVLQLVRDGNYLAVLAEGEYQAILAWQMLRQQAEWERPEPLPAQATLFQDMPGRSTNSEAVESASDLEGKLSGAAAQLEATYTRPYQMHGSIGPSCALAEYANGQLTIWTHSQGVYPLRGSVAAMLDLDEKDIRVIGVRGSGCYGHNGADDAAADAARLALALPGRPVRVQWMREDEHAWEPYGSAMRLHLRAALDADNRITVWETQLWTDVHSHRPGGDAAELLAAQYLEDGYEPPTEGFLGGGYRNSRPLYEIPNLQIEAHRIEGPLRVSALRSLGAYGNIFSIESFMDELAERAGEDPVAFRLKHLRDERARAVIEQVSTRVGWPGASVEGRGWGIAFARYKNEAAYCAVAAEVAYDAGDESLRVVRLVGAIDAGQVINPDGIKNQTEGGMIQSASWTLLEQVNWNAEGITSLDWESYPILRFPDVPEVEVIVVDRPDEDPLGAGEAAQGPTGAAIANAVYRATGVRVRDLPITAEKLRG